MQKKGKIIDRHIVVINQFAGNPESGWGERHFFLAREWKRLGYQVTILSSGTNHMFVQQKQINGVFLEEYYEGIRFLWTKIPRYNPKNFTRFIAMFGFVFQLMRIPSKIIPTNAIILLSSMPIFPALVINYLKWRWKGKKIVFEVRDMWPETPVQLLGYSKKHPFIRFIGWLERKMLKNASEVISLLPNTRNYMEEVVKKPLDWYYIPNGINIENGQPLAVGQKSITFLNEAIFLVVYTGTFGYANAMEILIKAIPIVEKKNSSIKFALLGEGYLKEQFQEQLKDQENVLFIPKIPKAQVQDFLKYADLCFISWHKSKLYDYGVSANKYFDYMYSGKPTLVISDDIIDPVKLSGSGWIYNIDDPELLASFIVQKSMMDKVELKKIGQSGRAYVLKEHTYPFLARKYLLAIDKAFKFNFETNGSIANSQ